MPRLFALLTLTLLLAGCAAVDSVPGGGGADAVDSHAFPVPALVAAGSPAVPKGGLDAVVVAVIDQRVNPYHLEWRASELPQHADADPGNDLALDRPPHEWLSGFPAPGSYASYEPLTLTLPDDPDAEFADLLATDDPTVPVSVGDEIHFRWVPGTKIVGVLDFRGDEEGPFRNSASHGARTSSVSVGSWYGACPECVLVFVQGDGTEEPIAWALSQPWIDAVTNSYGYSSTDTNTEADRHFVYEGCDLESQRAASERGMTLFWSGSNGLIPGLVPGTTLQSCQFGPDWIVTVGGIEDPDGDALWSGKPVDVAAPAERYPSQGGTTVGGEATIGGTSAATPIVAGTYARGLWQARAAMAGPSRAQTDGVVATGAFTCGDARPDCEVGDGILTAAEMRERLLHAAARTPEGFGLPGGAEPLPPQTESELLSEGHGSFLARREGEAGWLAESERVAGPLLGRIAAMERPPWERAWFVVDSFCRQARWGAWDGGYYVAGETSLPAPDPGWPVRTALAEACPLTATSGGGRLRG